MKASFQAVVRRWWLLLWGGRGAVSVAQPRAQVFSRPSTPIQVPVEEPKSIAQAPQPTDNLEMEAKAALAEIVMRPVVEPSFVGTPDDEQIAQRRTQTMAALAQLKQIPALQSLAQGFLQAASRTDVDLDEVVDAIGKDPALCVRVSRMANSAAIGSEKHIDDLTHAVQMLGLIRVRTLARALYTLRDSRSIAPGFDWRHLWVHALATATLAEELERRLGLPGDTLLYLSALLHDVGKIVLSVGCPDDYASVMVAAWNRTWSLDDLERMQLGMSHREAGEYYLERSGLPAAVVSCALHHHEPSRAPEEHRQQVAVVALANFLSKAYGLGFSGSTLGLDGQDDFVELAAWTVLEESTGRKFDREGIEAEIQAVIPEIKMELRGLKETAA